MKVSLKISMWYLQKYGFIFKFWWATNVKENFLNCLKSLGILLEKQLLRSFPKLPFKKKNVCFKTEGFCEQIY